MFQEWLKDYEKLRENNTMSEKEIIKEINIIKETIIGILKIDTENYIEDIYNIDTKQFKAILGLLDLYNKEKERNKDLEQIEKEHKEENGRLREENINLKEKIIRQQEQLNIANKKILAQKGQLKVVNNSYIPISKLKEKIEELNKEEKESLKGTKGQDRYSIKLEYMHKRNALQELLEESEK